MKRGHKFFFKSNFFGQNSWLRDVKCSGFFEISNFLQEAWFLQNKLDAE